MNRNDLECLIAEIVKKQLEKTTGEEKFITPEQLCERWQVSMRCLEKWRLQGKHPAYMKVQGGHKTITRYPLYGENGVLDVENQWLRNSTPKKG